MTKRTFENIEKKGRKSEWEWEETPEVTKALETLRATERLHAEMREKNK